MPQKRHAVAFTLLFLTHLPSNISAIKIKSPSTNVSRLQCVFNDGCMVWRGAVHTPLLKYHFSPWREGRVRVGCRLSDVPGWAFHHTPHKMDRENTLLHRDWLSAVGWWEGLTLWAWKFKVLSASRVVDILHIYIKNGTSNMLGN